MAFNDLGRAVPGLTQKFDCKANQTASQRIGKPSIIACRFDPAFYQASEQSGDQGFVGRTQAPVLTRLVDQLRAQAKCECQALLSPPTLNIDMVT